MKWSETEGLEYLSSSLVYKTSRSFSKKTLTLVYYAALGPFHSQDLKSYFFGVLSIASVSLYHTYCLLLGTDIHHLDFGI